MINWSFHSIQPAMLKTRSSPTLTCFSTAVTAPWMTRFWSSMASSAAVQWTGCLRDVLPWVRPSICIWSQVFANFSKDTQLSSRHLVHESVCLVQHETCRASYSQINFFYFPQLYSVRRSGCFSSHSKLDYFCFISRPGLSWFLVIAFLICNFVV